jgi:hypothetical protein
VKYEIAIDLSDESSDEYEDKDRPLMLFEEEKDFLNFSSENEEDDEVVTSSNGTDKTEVKARSLSEDYAIDDKQMPNDNKAEETGKLQQRSENDHIPETSLSCLRPTRPEIARRFHHSSSPDTQHLGAIPKRRLVHNNQREDSSPPKEANGEVTGTRDSDLLIRNRRRMERENQLAYEIFHSEDDDDSVR